MIGFMINVGSRTINDQRYYMYNT